VATWDTFDGFTVEDNALNQDRFTVGRYLLGNVDGAGYTTPLRVLSYTASEGTATVVVDGAVEALGTSSSALLFRGWYGDRAPCEQIASETDIPASYPATSYPEGWECEIGTRQGYTWCAVDVGGDRDDDNLDGDGDGSREWRAKGIPQPAIADDPTDEESTAISADAYGFGMFSLPAGLRYFHVVKTEIIAKPVDPQSSPNYWEVTFAGGQAGGTIGTTYSSDGVNTSNRWQDEEAVDVLADRLASLISSNALKVTWDRKGTGGSLTAAAATVLYLPIIRGNEGV